MNAVSQDSFPASSIDFGANTAAEAVVSSSAGRVSTRALLAIISSFWLYVTLSNLLYAYAMQHFASSISRAHLFASWDARVIQHLLLYPVLFGCVLLSMRIGWKPAWRTWPLQILLSLFFSALASPALMAGEMVSGDKTWQQGPSPHSFASFWKGPEPSVWLSSITNFELTYGFCLALVTGFALYQRFRDSQLRVSALERAWSTARLATLRMQLSPHTLFNLLHTIRGQINWDPHKAQTMIVQLGDLLRRLLSAGERDFSRLSDELHFIYSYLELQKQRFPDRLTLQLPQVEVQPALWIPSLILQPLVENAVAHGLSGHEGPVTVRIEIETQDRQLTVRVINTMAPFRAVGREGVGLRNVRERLAVQFPDKASLEAGPAESGSWIATVRLPLLRDGPSASPPVTQGAEPFS
jgi:hypothetical protein